MKKLSPDELRKLPKLAAAQHLMGWSTSELSALLWELREPFVGKPSKGAYIDQVLTALFPRTTPTPPPAAAEVQQLRLC